MTRPHTSLVLSTSLLHPQWQTALQPTLTTLCPQRLILMGPAVALAARDPLSCLKEASAASEYGPINLPAGISGSALQQLSAALVQWATPHGCELLLCGQAAAKYGLRDESKRSSSSSSSSSWQLTGFMEILQLLTKSRREPCAALDPLGWVLKDAPSEDAVTASAQSMLLSVNFNFDWDYTARSCEYWWSCEQWLHLLLTAADVELPVQACFTVRSANHTASPDVAAAHGTYVPERFMPEKLQKQLKQLQLFAVSTKGFIEESKLTPEVREEIKPLLPTADSWQEYNEMLWPQVVATSRFAWSVEEE